MFTRVALVSLALCMMMSLIGVNSSLHAEPADSAAPDNAAQPNTPTASVESTNPADAATYDPLKLADQLAIKTLDLTVRDEARDRAIPLRIYLPASTDPQPIVLFSHGLGGTCKNNAYLGQHWAGRGYVAVFLEHPGSNDAVWRDVPVAQRRAAMAKAASAANFMLRVKDVPAVLDALTRWHADPDHALHDRLDRTRVGMSGHSFGAVTTQAVSGQVMGRNLSFTDPRIVAAVALSPSSPQRGEPREAFGQVKIPWLLMTGTHDEALIGHADVASRLAVYPALPPGDEGRVNKYELVLHNGEHSAFSDRALPGDRQQRNPNHHRAILALSTAFWDAHLRQDQSATAWLNGQGPASVLEEKDRWQKK